MQLNIVFTSSCENFQLKNLAISSNFGQFSDDLGILMKSDLNFVRLDQT